MASIARIEPSRLDGDEPGYRGLTWLPELVTLYESGVDQGFLADLLVHGSFGDFTQTHYSDLELTVVLSASERSAPVEKQYRKWLGRKLYPLMLKVDPLQHHGEFVLTPEISSCYDEVCLPLCAYDNCWSITGNAIEINLVTQVDRLKRENQKRLALTVDSLINARHAFYRYGVSMYVEKRMLSNLFMVPVYYYQSLGQLLCKKEAIERFLAEDHWPDLSKAIRIGSEIRTAWPQPPVFLGKLRGMLSSASFPKRKLDLAATYLYRCKHIHDKVLNDLIEPMNAGLLEIKNDRIC